MKLTEQERMVITEGARQFGVGAVYVFGSSLESEDPEDLDLAVQGAPPGAFFKFHGWISRRLSRPVDLVDLAADNPVTRLIAREAVQIYG